MVKIFPSYQSSTKAPTGCWLAPQLCFSPAAQVPPGENLSATCTLLIYERNHKSCAAKYYLKTISSNLFSSHSEKLNLSS